MNISIASLIRPNKTVISRNDVTRDEKSIQSKHPKVLSNPAMVYDTWIRNLLHVETVDDADLNHRPIIGILTQELGPILQKWYGDKYTSYIGSAYIKYIEAAGARVVPVLINQPMEYYEIIFNSINGLLFPGGGASWSESGELLFVFLCVKKAVRISFCLDIFLINKHRMMNLSLYLEKSQYL